MVEELKEIRVKRKEMASLVNEDLGNQVREHGPTVLYIADCHIENTTVEKSTALNSERPGLELQCCPFIVVRQHSVFLLSLSLTFFICKMDTMSSSNGINLFWELSVMMLFKYLAGPGPA